MLGFPISAPNESKAQFIGGFGSAETLLICLSILDRLAIATVSADHAVVHTIPSHPIRDPSLAPSGGLLKLQQLVWA